MDRKKFLDWLSEVAYWEYPNRDKFTPKTKQAKNRKIKAQLLKLGLDEERISRLELDEDIEEDEEQEQEEVMPFVKDGVNLTKYPVIIAVKHEAKSCGDCGKQVVNRRIECKVYTTEDKHWRRRCTACDLVWDPESQTYAIPPTHAHFYFRGKKSLRGK